MRVAVIAKAIDPDMGGAERVTAKVVEHLKEKCKLKVTAKYKRTVDAGERPEMGILIDDEWSKMAAKEAMKFNPDFTYVCGYWGETTPIYLHCRKITMHHDVELENLPISDSLKSKLFKITKERLDKSDIVATPSEYAKEYVISKFNVDESKIEILPPGLDLESRMCRKNGNYILYVGRIAPNKGIHNLIEAFKGIDEDVKLKIVGGYTASYLDYFFKLVEMSKTNRKIEFLGRVNRVELIKLYSSASVVVCPSIAHESFGIVPLEALYHCGVVVASDIFVKTGVLNERIAFVYPKHDVEMLKEKIIKALSLDRGKIESLKKKAEKHVKKFSWESHFKKLGRILAL